MLLTTQRSPKHCGLRAWRSRSFDDSWSVTENGPNECDKLWQDVFLLPQCIWILMNKQSEHGPKINPEEEHNIHVLKVVSSICFEAVRKRGSSLPQFRSVTGVLHTFVLEETPHFPREIALCRVHNWILLAPKNSGASSVHSRHFSLINN